MIIIPTLVLPLILSVVTKISHNFEKEAAEKPLKIGVVSNHNELIKELKNVPTTLGAKSFVYYKDSSSLKNDLKNDSIQIGFFVPTNVAELKEKMQPISVTVFHDGTDLGMQDRADSYLDYIHNKWQKERYKTLKINESTINPIAKKYTNVASNQEMIGKLIGGFLPYLIISFAFMGCMFPAIDLFTGERERGTIETLLTVPVARWKILFGKMGVVVFSGLMASTFSFIGIYLSIEVFDLVENPEILAVIKDILSPAFIGMLYLLLLPLVVFFAGLMIVITVRAKTFKEAQSLLSPLNILVVLPAMSGLFPGFELNEMTAMIPIVNIVLATKELMAGTLEWHLVALSFGIMIVLAIGAVFLSYKKFESESTLIA
jgi:sodium transport system permease protein